MRIGFWSVAVLAGIVLLGCGREEERPAAAPSPPSPEPPPREVAAVPATEEEPAVGHPERIPLFAGDRPRYRFGV